MPKHPQKGARCLPQLRNLKLWVRSSLEWALNLQEQESPDFLLSVIYVTGDIWKVGSVPSSVFFEGAYPFRLNSVFSWQRVVDQSTSGRPQVSSLCCWLYVLQICLSEFWSLWFPTPLWCGVDGVSFLLPFTCAISLNCHLSLGRCTVLLSVHIVSNNLEPFSPPCSF